MENKYKGKWFSVLGDSISTFEYFIPEDNPTYYSALNKLRTGVEDYKDTWWGQVIDYFDGKLLVNESWSGSYVCRVPYREEKSSGSSDERTGNLGRDGISPDAILVHIGTNDRGAGFRLKDDDKNDLTVIENAYALMLDKLKKNYPKAEIWCCTFCKTTCSKNPYFVFPETNNGIPMSEYGELIRCVAESRGCGVIDLFACEELCDTVDGLHPTREGMKLIAREVINTMKK